MALVLAVLLAGIPWEICVLYLIGAIVLIIGLTTAKNEVSRARDTDKLIPFGPVFLAVPMAVFGMEHFTFYDSVAPLIPSWIPWHPFWVFFVGACFVGGAFALVVRKCARLAAALFAIMLLLFEVLISIPRIAGAPGDRFAWAVALRDLAFSGGGLAFAATQTEACTTQSTLKVITLARFFIGFPILFFGAEHFLHPEFTPGVPLKMLTPLWIPGHLLWAYLTAAVFVVTGLALIFNKEPRWAATWLGLMILLLVLALYVPIVIAKPSAIGNGLNSLVDTLLLSGSALCFAGSQPGRSVR